jgi:hypothetical protein
MEHWSNNNDKTKPKYLEKNLSKCRFNVTLSGKVKVKFTIEQAMKAQRGSTGIALLFL